MMSTKCFSNVNIHSTVLLTDYDVTTVSIIMDVWRYIMTVAGLLCAAMLLYSTAREQ